MWWIEQVSRWTATLVAVAVSAASAVAQDNAQFPVIFEKASELNALGLSLEGPGGRSPKFKNTCYEFGGEASTVYLISFSDAFFERYRRRGFTRESLCLGLVSQTRFDPETGKRLPSYVLVYPDELRKALKGKDRSKLTKAEIDALSESGVMTDELPLVVPDCFKNGTPYLDCNMRFGLTSGVPVRAVTAKRMRAFAQAWDRQVIDAIKSGKNLHVSAVSDGGPYLPIAGYWGMNPLYDGQPKGVMVPEAMWQTGDQFSMTWTVISPNLPRGYGYALHATGELGPAVSSWALRAALGQKRSQVSPASLRRMIAD